MSDPIDIPHEAPEHDQEELDNPMRLIIVINSPDVPDSDMDERLLDSIQSFDDMNTFFDKFDESVAIPNDGHIKYEVGSDGLVVIVVDSKDLKKKTLDWVDEYVVQFGDKLVDQVEESSEDDQASKKQRK